MPLEVRGTEPNFLDHWSVPVLTREQEFHSLPVSNGVAALANRGPRFELVGLREKPQNGGGCDVISIHFPVRA